MTPPTSIRRGLSRFLPRRLAAYLDAHGELTRALVNMQWLLLQTAVDAVLGVGVGIWVARELGPSGYGALSYALAFVALGAPVAMLGLGTLVVRDLVSRPDQAPVILGSTRYLRVLGSLGLMATTMTAAVLVRPDDPTMWSLVAVVAIGHALKNVGVYELWFHANVQAKYTTLARSISGIVTGAMKVAGLLGGAPVLFFAFAYAIELVLDTVLMGLYYRATAQVRRSDWQVQRDKVRELFSQSWPLVFSGLLASVYLMIDQVMIGQLLGEAAVGEYAAAVRLSEAFFLVVSIALTSVFPSLVRARSISRELYLGRFQQLYDVFVWFAVAAGITMQLLAAPVVSLLYGDRYHAAASTLAIHIWSGLFWFSGSVGHRYLITENLTRLTLWMTGSGAVVNVVLNLVLIPRAGIDGAAWATLISFAFSHCLAAALFRESRLLLVWFSRATNLLGALRRLRPGDPR